MFELLYKKLSEVNKEISFLKKKREDLETTLRVLKDLQSISRQVLDLADLHLMLYGKISTKCIEKVLINMGYKFSKDYVSICLLRNRKKKNLK